MLALSDSRVNGTNNFFSGGTAFYYLGASGADQPPAHLIIQRAHGQNFLVMFTNKLVRDGSPGLRWNAMVMLIGPEADAEKYSAR